MPAIQAHWKKENIKFKAIYTGYLGSIKQVGYVRDILKTMGTDDCVRIVDPAMADNGQLYSIFNQDYVEAMKVLCGEADILVPNITEACFLTDEEYKETYDEGYICNLVEKLKALGAKTVVLTGVSYESGKTGVVVYENGKMEYYKHDKIAKGSHGTGDIYASAFVGALMNDKSVYEAAKIANCIAEVLPVRIAEIIDGASMEVVDSAVPNTNKVAPSITKYTAVGLILGVLISVAIIAVMAILDDTIHDDEYVLRTYNCPVLAKIPDLMNTGTKSYSYYYQHKDDNKETKE
jgi:pyridoxal/pyridoxine/pyridoxamine kinase